MNFEKIWEEAKAAGSLAHSSAACEPMHIREASVLGGPIPGGRSYVVPDGPCGFAGIRFKATTPFGRWAKRAGIARPAYPSGLHIGTNNIGGSYSQSLTRAEAAAYAVAEALRKHGITVYTESRMD